MAQTRNYFNSPSIENPQLEIINFQKNKVVFIMFAKTKDASVNRTHDSLKRVNIPFK